MSCDHPECKRLGYLLKIKPEQLFRVDKKIEKIKRGGGVEIIDLLTPWRLRWFRAFYNKTTEYVRIYPCFQKSENAITLLNCCRAAKINVYYGLTHVEIRFGMKFSVSNILEKCLLQMSSGFEKDCYLHDLKINAQKADWKCR